MRIKRTGDDCCGPWENIAQQIAAIWTAIYNKVGSVNGKLPVNNGELELTASDVDAYDKDETDGLLAQKQNVLTAGANITIEDDVISATGGGASYEAGSGIAISDENVISNTAPNVKSDWNAASGSDAEILNKPSLATVATSGSYTDLTDKPSIPAAQVQSDWDQSDNTQVDYIKNKPSIPSVSDRVAFTTGSGAPSGTPSADGLMYFDTTNGYGYEAVNINGTRMWQRIGNAITQVAAIAPATAPTGLNMIYVDTLNNDIYISQFVYPDSYEWQKVADLTTVDSALDTSSTNPVENSVVALALDDKAGMTVGAADPTTSTVGSVGDFYLNGTSKALFQCTAVTSDGQTPPTYTYTWGAVGGGGGGGIEILKFKQSISISDYQYFGEYNGTVPISDITVESGYDYIILGSTSLGAFPQYGLNMRLRSYSLTVGSPLKFSFFASPIGAYELYGAIEITVIKTPKSGAAEKSYFIPVGTPFNETKSATWGKTNNYNHTVEPNDTQYAITGLPKSLASGSVYLEIVGPSTVLTELGTVSASYSTVAWSGTLTVSWTGTIVTGGDLTFKIGFNQYVSDGMHIRLIPTL